ncbi:MAG: CsgG/HfaB family protein [Idiomarina sp.]|nr:CsgG/HfaB family protein [Idiomarina sp.]
MRKVSLIIASLVMSGCALMPKPTDINIQPAEIDAPSSTMTALKQRQLPQTRIPVSVYAFRDQTGQYKPQANVSSFSTAVTQGATSMLTQMLLESGWFLPMERENLQNLLTERKIYNSGDNKELPPLSEARLLLEGGIISYDTNVSTGGIGAEYFGIGASELYREDQVSVYLRAVDVYSGQVLVSVSANKKVFSQELRAGLFRYVSLNRLAEFEGGYSTNEPVQLSVKQAMERALVELIEKGLEMGYWRAES